MIFFSADHHFGHANIIKYCNRPYQSVEEMDADYIKRWNARVTQNDTVYYLGDMAGRIVNILRLLNKLNFQILHWMPGNHDSPGNIYKAQWGCIRVFPCRQQIVEIQPVYNSQLVSIVLCHYPIMDWVGIKRGVLHLHGHSHGTVTGPAGSLDVGVDKFPDLITLDEVLDRLRDAC